MATGANKRPCLVAPLVYIRVHELPVFQVSRNSNALRIHICHRRTHTDQLSNFAKTVFIRRNKCLFLVTQNLVTYLLTPVWSALCPPALETTQKKSISPVFTDNMDFILQSVFYFVAMRSANASASSICAQKYSLPMRLSNPAFSIICIGCSFT